MRRLASLKCLTRSRTFQGSVRTSRKYLIFLANHNTGANNPIRPMGNQNAKELIKRLIHANGFVVGEQQYNNICILIKAQS